ncbi:MAG: squalene--hopene cyclase [Acidobacteriota bacterium]
MTPSLQVTDALVAAAAKTARQAVEWFADNQHESGYWWGDLTADTTLEADYILLQLWLYPPQQGSWNPPVRQQIDRAVRSVRERQLAEGGFNLFPDGPADVNASIKAYFALKVAGVAVAEARMVALRETILRLGGLQAANSYVKINLSLFGLYPRPHVPSIPPELILLGKTIYEMSSWTRAIVIPLSIVQALTVEPRPVPAGFSLEELLVPGVSLALPRDDGFFNRRNTFLRIDKAFKLWERFGSGAVRRRAIRKAMEWITERTRYTDGLAAIYPPMMYTIMAMDLLGYAADHPDRAEAENQFANLMVDDGERFFFQPCFSVVWDTAIACHALGESGMAAPEMLARAGEWLLTKEVRRKGDWSVKRPTVEPSGWYFEFANEHYPDIDDTAMVLLGLQDSACGKAAVSKRAVDWLLAMQSSDGGWAAFDVDNNWQFLSDVPFADHNAMLDPTCPDITGRVVEALTLYGVRPDHPAIRKGVAYLERAQEADGSWQGRWGVNYIYGTCFAVRGLRAAGESDREVAVLRAGEWLRSIQNADGGWGESPESYRANVFVAAPSTPSQTAWAVLGLLASGDTYSSSVQRGVEYLIQNQNADGTWSEEAATGTGFPNVFYLRYHLYRNSFPLLALATFLKAER